VDASEDKAGAEVVDVVVDCGTTTPVSNNQAVDQLGSGRLDIIEDGDNERHTLIVKEDIEYHARRTLENKKFEEYRDGDNGSNDDDDDAAAR